MQRTSIALSVLACGLAQAAFGGTVQLIQNGGFEGGSTASWTASVLTFPDTTGACNNTFASQSAATGCVAGANPSFGSYAAYSSSAFLSSTTGTGEFVNILAQDFIVPASFTSLVLTWDDAATWGGVGTFDGVGVLVSIYNGAAFVANQYSLTNPSSAGSFSWTDRSWDLTSVLQPYAGQTLTLRLQALTFLDNRGGESSSAGTFLNAGFDNVSLTAITPDAEVPEPATFAVSGLGVLALAAFRRYRTR